MFFFSFRFLPEVISDMMLSTIDQTGKIGESFLISLKEPFALMLIVI